MSNTLTTSKMNTFNSKVEAETAFLAAFQSAKNKAKHLPTALFGEDKEAMELCQKMMEWVGLGEYFDLAMKPLEYSNPYPVVKALFHNCINFIRSGYWGVGFDKCEVTSVESMNYLGWSYALECIAGSVIHFGYGIRVGHLEDSNYVTALVAEEALADFMGSLKVVVGERVNFISFGGITFKFEDYDITFPSFSSVDVEKMLEFADPLTKN